MKKIILGLLMLIGITSVQAQEYEYVPLVREGVKWTYYITPNHDNSPIRIELEFKGDTSFGNYSSPVFKKCYLTIDKEYADCWPLEIDENGSSIIALVREENKRVFAAYTDEFINANGQQGSLEQVGEYATGLKTKCYLTDNNYFQQEWMIYDFNDPTGLITRALYIFDHLTNIFHYLYCESKEMIQINDRLRKQYVLNCEDDYDISLSSLSKYKLTEGVGWEVNSNYVLGLCVSPRSCFKDFVLCQLSHVEENGNIVYKTPFYDIYNTPDNVNDMKVETPENGDNNYYNLMGQPVADPTEPGIYIHHGKKIVIK